MTLVPENRTLFAVDVVGSASTRGYHVGEIVPAITSLVDTALHRSGLAGEDVLDRESTGDGAILTLPGSYLGAVLDAAEYLDRAAVERNKRSKPEIRLRMAVETGPVGVVPGYYPAKTALDRMLNATAFKDLFDRCREIGASDEVNTALIVSEHAKRTAFSGDHLQVLREGEFVRLPVRNKEYTAEAWVRVPGFDRRTTAELITAGEADAAGADAAPEPGSGAAAAEPASSNSHVHNEVHGSHNDIIQADVIHGGVNTGRRSR
ncbi:hypothetical protein [Saccharopolyspora gloriosae]|uniref:hypothetical protein n=1 Tax=Saccharopolyspora gloriosae TaxID=455344 RepID=UPI001FB59103|nr:hypothetical protein [Saccharopolyspora gloriosae]